MDLGHLRALALYQKLSSLLPIVLLQPGRDLRNFRGRVVPQETTGYMVWKGEQEVSE